MIIFMHGGVYNFRNKYEDGVVRLSFTHYNSLKDTDLVLKALDKI